MRILLGAGVSEGKLDRLRAAAPGAELLTAADRATALDLISGMDAYVPGPWDPEVFAAAGRLRWVHFRWAGVGAQIFPALARSAVTVTNSAGVFAVPMAEHAMALILAFTRSLHLCLPPRGGADPWAATAPAARGHMREMLGATLGVLGYGGIGRAAA